MFWILTLLVAIIYWIIKAEEECIKRRIQARKKRYRFYKNIR